MNASESTTLFLPPMDCVKNLILSEVAIERWPTKLYLSSSKSCKVAGFQTLINAEMSSILVLDAVRLLDSFMTFTYKKNDGYFALITNAISSCKVHVDFEFKYYGGFLLFISKY